MDEKEPEEIIAERKQKQGRQAKTVKVSMLVNVETYALLEIFAKQFDISIPHALELIFTRVFPRDIAKLKTQIHYLLKNNMEFADILNYLKLGERNENRILWLHNQLSKKD